MFAVRQFEAKTLSWWADQRDDIDFSPPYQRRGGLWSLGDKQYLIDSILNQYDIPKLYLADFTAGSSALNVSNLQYAVIDGRQRFEAILDFIDGRVTLAGDFEYGADPTLELGGLSYRDLSLNFPKVARRFDNFNLSVMTVVTDEAGKINELFVRLNRNKTLTGPEIRNAMRGVVPPLIRRLADDDFFKTRIGFTTVRGQDLDAAGKMLLVEFRGRLVETKKAVIDRFVTEGYEVDADSSDAPTSDFERAAERVASVLERLNTVFTPKDPLLGTQGSVIPYYWLVRTADSENVSSIRPFLVHFESQRRSNRKAAAEQSNTYRSDSELDAYDRMNRSINDGTSLEGRYAILRRRFAAFLAR